jgi:hypothetical protein
MFELISDLIKLLVNCRHSLLLQLKNVGRIGVWNLVFGGQGECDGASVFSGPKKSDRGLDLLKGGLLATDPLLRSEHIQSKIEDRRLRHNYLAFVRGITAPISRA